MTVNVCNAWLIRLRSRCGGECFVTMPTPECGGECFVTMPTLGDHDAVVSDPSLGPRLPHVCIGESGSVAVCW